jgi:hypothetical protein
VHQRLERRAIPDRVETAHERRGLGPMTRSNASMDCSTLATRPKPARRRRTDHLAIVGLRVATDDMNRVGGGVDVIEGAIEIVEAARASGAAIRGRRAITRATRATHNGRHEKSDAQNSGRLMT